MIILKAKALKHQTEDGGICPDCGQELEFGECGNCGSTGGEKEEEELEMLEGFDENE